MINFHQAKILVVDDDYVNRRLLRQIMQTDNYSIMEAVDGISCIEMVKDTFPDIILLDVMMPRLDGFGVVEKLKNSEQFKEIPIVLITALDDQDSRVKGLSLGSEDFITKPFSYKEVLLRVRNLLRLKKSHDFIKRNNQLLRETDRLTGLPNKETIKRLSADLIANKENVAIIAIQLSQLTNIVNAFGSQAIDDIICLCADRLSFAAPEGGMLAYVNEGKFILAVPMQSEQELPKIINSLKLPFKKAIRFQDSEIFMGLNIGITVYPKDSGKLDNLYSNAEIALNYAMRDGSNVTKRYERKMSITSEDKFTLAANLNRAILRGEMQLYYQPIVDLATKQVVSTESLTRWVHNRVFVSPAKFIPLIEELNLMKEFNRWLFNKVSLDLSDFKPKNKLCVTINISAYALYSTDIVKAICQIVQKVDNNKIQLGIEITESSLISNFDKAMCILKKLKENNIKLLIDDFGIGYSSFSYLQKIPADVIKIDRMLINNIEKDQKAQAIVKSIVQLSNNLEMETVAEGIETKEQYEFLTSINCSKGQGYYFHKPLPKEQYSTIIKN